MSRKMKKGYWLMNIFLPLAAGTIIYIVTSSSLSFFWTQSKEWRFIRNYLPDMLWGYALMNTLFFLGIEVDEEKEKRNIGAITSLFLLGFFFSAGMELLQLTPLIKGTFDIWDILLEGFAELTAAIMMIFFDTNTGSWREINS